MCKFQAHITEDLCRCFGGLERNGVQTQLVTAVTYLGPRLLVAALKMHIHERYINSVVRGKARTQRQLTGFYVCLFECDFTSLRFIALSLAWTISGSSPLSGLTHKRNSRWVWWLFSEECFHFKPTRKRLAHNTFHAAASERDTASPRKEDSCLLIVHSNEYWTGVFNQPFGPCSLTNLTVVICSSAYSELGFYTVEFVCSPPRLCGFSPMTSKTCHN